MEAGTNLEAEEHRAERERLSRHAPCRCPAPHAPPLELGSSRHRVKSGVTVALGGGVPSM